jgi:SAM-dependent methyltransferase
MRIAWVLGWAVPEEWFGLLVKTILPDADHHFFPATEAGLAHLCEPVPLKHDPASVKHESVPIDYEHVPFDWVVGYSLGSLLLLCERCHGLTKNNNNSKDMAPTRVALLAPIFAFPREAGLGGKVPEAQIRQLARGLSRDPRNALEGFYRYAGLNVPSADVPTPPVEDLLWGLQRLEADRVDPPLPAGWRAWCGADDTLLDAARLREVCPEVTVVAGATHHPRALIEAFAAEVERADPGALGDIAGRTCAPGSARSTSVLSSFERAAPGYLAHASAQEDLAAWLAAWLPAARAGRALEVGAGPGVFTRRLLPWNGELTATDFSPAMCAAGRSRVPEVRWRTMAAEAPEPGPWDWIFSSSMLQWAEDPAAVFAGWKKRLAPGGRVLAGLFAGGSLEEWGALAGEAPLRWRTPEDWRGLLAASGLRLLRDDSEERVFYHGSAAAMLRSLHGTGAAPRRRLSPTRLRELLREYEEQHRTVDGVPATWRFYRFEAGTMD